MLHVTQSCTIEGAERGREDVRGVALSAASGENRGREMDGESRGMGYRGTESRGRR